MALPIFGNFKRKSYTVTMADISAASSAFVVIGARCKIIGGYVVISGAITGADSALTAKISGTAITGFTGTAANSGSAAGTVFTMADPTGANIANAGDAVELISDGASSTTAIATWTLIVAEF
jgi:hypothetical protein